MKKLYTLLTMLAIGHASIYGYGQFRQRGEQGPGRNCPMRGRSYNQYEGTERVSSRIELDERIMALSISEQMKSDLNDLKDKVRALPFGSTKNEARKHLHDAVSFAEINDIDNAIKEIDSANKLLAEK